MPASLVTGCGKTAYTVPEAIVTRWRTQNTTAGPRAGYSVFAPQRTPRVIARCGVDLWLFLVAAWKGQPACAFMLVLSQQQHAAHILHTGQACYQTSVQSMPWKVRVAPEVVASQHARQLPQLPRSNNSLPLPPAQKAISVKAALCAVVQHVHHPAERH